MITLLSIIGLGFLLGLSHATDADHVIAVTTIVNRKGDLRHAAMTGLAWGLGHTLTIFVVGSAIILLGVVIPGYLELSMELSVSCMLILLGLFSLYKFYRSMPHQLAGVPQSSVIHSHHHRHGDYIHQHSHGHQPEAHPHPESQTPLSTLDRHFGSWWLYRHLRPLVVGVVHGLAGSAAVALLILTTIPNSNWGIAYLLVFGLGTITGMTLFTLSLALGSTFLNRRFRGFSHWISLPAGILSIGFGIFMAFQLLQGPATN